MTEEVEWFGGRVDWASSESLVCQIWSPIGRGPHIATQVSWLAHDVE